MQLPVKNISLILLIPICCVVIACDRMYTNYMHENGVHAETIIEQNFNVRSYVDLVNSSLSDWQLRESLIYMLNDEFLQVRCYSEASEPVLYIERRGNRQEDPKETYYYLKDGRVVYKAQRQAGSQQQLVADIHAGVNYNDNIAYLEDALNMKNDFDLVFKGITTSPKAKYLILSKKREANAFLAPIKIAVEDDLIRELASNPDMYQGCKLDVKWTYGEDDELIYEQASLKRPEY